MKLLIRSKALHGVIPSRQFAKPGLGGPHETSVQCLKKKKRSAVVWHENECNVAHLFSQWRAELALNVWGRYVQRQYPRLFLAHRFHDRIKCTDERQQRRRRLPMSFRVRQCHATSTICCRLKSFFGLVLEYDLTVNFPRKSPNHHRHSNTIFIPTNVLAYNSARGS